MIKLTRIEQKRPERKILNDLQHINIGLMVYPIPQRNTITMDIVKKIMTNCNLASKRAKK
jgi:hypothetical protein